MLQECRPKRQAPGHQSLGMRLEPVRPCHGHRRQYSPVGDACKPQDMDGTKCETFGNMVPGFSNPNQDYRR